MPVAEYPPHRSVRAELPHTAPASGHDAKRSERTRSSPVNAFPLLGVRHAGDSSAFPLAAPLPSTSSAEPAPEKSMGAHPTSQRRRWQGYGFPFLPRPTRLRRAPLRPPSSCVSNFPACSGSPTAQDHSATRVLRRTVCYLPPWGTTSASRIENFAAQWLACRCPCQRFASHLAMSHARLGVKTVRYSFLVLDFHQLSLTSLC